MALLGDYLKFFLGQNCLVGPLKKIGPKWPSHPHTEILPEIFLFSYTPNAWIILNRIWALYGQEVTSTSGGLNETTNKMARGVRDTRTQE